MAKAIVSFPDCRCGNWFAAYLGCERWDYTKERGEWVPIEWCKKGIGCLRWQPYAYTPLKRCAHCKRLGTGRRIKYRSDCYLVDRVHELDLCMACWNRYRPIVKRIRMMLECQRLANKIRRLSVTKRGS